MIESITRVEARKKDALTWYENNKNGDYKELGLMAHFCQVPVIVIVHWVGESGGWTPELIRIGKVIMEFYGYTEIIGRNPNAPI